MGKFGLPLFAEDFVDQRCLSIFCTLLPSRRLEPTSSRGSYRVRIASSWTSSVLVAFRLQLCLAMHSRLSSAGPAMLCSANPQEGGPGSLKDAAIERRLIKERIRDVKSVISLN